MSTDDTLAYYTRPGTLTAAGLHEDTLRALPESVPELFASIHGLLIHECIPGPYGLDREPGYTDTAHIRTMEAVVDRLVADGRPLTERRDPADRFGGCCRHFTVFAVAALRAHGIPARARCGFGTYFESGWHIDHWVAERWDADQSRWILCDAQIDEVILPGLPVAIDPLDLARDQFVVAGDAWRRYRAGDLDPDRCGLAGTEGESGWWWIAGNLVRDVAALSGMEMLPWDVWGAMPEPGPDTEQLHGLLDRLADITADPDTAADVRALYETEDGLRVPEKVLNFLRGREEAVTAA